MFLNLFVHIYEGPNEEPAWCHLPAQRKTHHYCRYFNAHRTRFVYYHHLSIILFLFADERQLWELHCKGLYSREHTTIQVSVIFFLAKRTAWRRVSTVHTRTTKQRLHLRIKAAANMDRCHSQKYSSHALCFPNNRCVLRHPQRWFTGVFLACSLPQRRLIRWACPRTQLAQSSSLTTSRTQ